MKKISNEMKSDLITTAIEGGSNYWYLFEEEATGCIVKYKTVEHPQNKYHTFSEAIFVAIEAGESVPVHSMETGELLGNLTKDSIDKAMGLLHDQFPHVYANIIAEDFDAGDADVWFQLAVIGKVLFG